MQSGKEESQTEEVGNTIKVGEVGEVEEGVGEEDEEEEEVQEDEVGVGDKVKEHLQGLAGVPEKVLKTI